MKKLFLPLLFVITGTLVHSQAMLTIDSCYARARQQFPLIKQKDLIEKTKDYSVANAAKGYLPQLSFNAQVTTQSAVTKIPIDIPNLPFTIPVISKNQFNIHGEIDQGIYDGGAIKQQEALDKSNADVASQTVEVQLYALKDRINQLFFGTLLIDEQIKQNAIVQKDLQNSIEKMQAAVNNGIVLASSLNELQAELLIQQQNEISLKSSRAAYIEMLGLFINLPLDEKTVLQTPIAAAVSDNIVRPELSLYDYQKKSDDIREKLLLASVRPKFLFFFQGGYALPGLNGFNVNPAFYYLTGFRLSWSIGNYYTLKNQRALLGIDKQSIDIQKDIFLFNTHMLMKQQNGEIVKLQQMIGLDNDIISKRTAVKDAAKAQLDNGSVTVHDYIGQLYAEDVAKQNLLLHKVQLLMAEYNYQNTTGN